MEQSPYRSNCERSYDFDSVETASSSVEGEVDDAKGAVAEFASEHFELLDGLEQPL